MSVAAKTEQALKVKRNPSHTGPVRGLKKPKDIRIEWRRTTYVVGDGDHTVYIPRPGSDHSRIKSFGFPT